MRRPSLTLWTVDLDEVRDAYVASAYAAARSCPGRYESGYTLITGDEFVVIWQCRRVSDDICVRDECLPSLKTTG